MGLVYGHGNNDMPYGWASESEENQRVYQAWCKMLERCYSEKCHEKYPTYKDCTVCERWLLLSNFTEDFPKIDGYELWLNNPNKRISLDKDIKSNGENKEYSLENCMLVSITENVRQANKTRDYTQFQGENHPFYGKHHSDEAKRKMSEANSIKIAQYDKQTNELIKVWHGSYEIQRELGIAQSNIISCCKGKRKSAGGYIWKYYKKEE